MYILKIVRSFYLSMWNSQHVYQDDAYLDSPFFDEDLFFFFIEYSDSNTILDKHEVLYQNNQHKREVTHIILLRVQLNFFSF